ncbi:MAG: FAD-dependent oxidoreductase [Sandaracinaceae bacterium]|nr:FAD-dependent oxidoreductase [Sandaracinaceae bacterium]
MSSTIVIAGASLAGGRAAETLRRSGFEGRLILVGQEPHRPYDRPPLSKKFLHHQQPEDKLFFRPESYYEEHKIELVLGTRAAALHASAREIELEGGRRVAFDQLLITTGADVRKLTCEGADLEGVHYVRTLEDSRALREELRPGRRAVVIGAGVIGAEVAAACRQEGVEVVMVEVAELPLLRAFGPETARLYADVHREHGVDLRCGAGVTALRGARRVQEVLLSNGERVECDFVVAGIGVRPAVTWLEGSGVAIEHGVLVDERCRTNVPGVFAAGDVSVFYSAAHGRHVAVESVDNAQTQAICAAYNMTGKDAEHVPVPFFWSDQYDLKLQIVGHVGDYDRVAIRGSLADRKLTIFHLAKDELRYAVGINRLKEMGASKKLIATRAKVDAAALADESVSLATFFPK